MLIQVTCNSLFSRDHSNISSMSLLSLGNSNDQSPSAVPLILKTVVSKGLTKVAPSIKASYFSGSLLGSTGSIINSS